jgi:hypothetical protein
MNIERRKQSRWLILPLCLIVMAGCEKVQFEPVVIPNDSISYSNVIQPIFDNSCVSCHPPTKGLDLTVQNSYNAIVPEFAAPADSSDPGQSKLYLKLNGSSHKPRTSDIEKQEIFNWISQGVKNN